ncbi:YadA domain-containing protein, partial [Achromobacter arsenitoxydans SY8]
GSQLYATNQNVAGHSTAISNLDGRVTSNTSAITAIDGRVTENEGDIVNLTNSLNSGGVGLVRQDAVSRNITIAKSLDGTLVDLSGTAGARTLDGVKAGALNASSLEAVSGSQLYATNQNVLANTTALNTLDGLVAQNTTNLNNLTASINMGALGLVKQDDVSRVLSVGKEQDGGLVDFTGTAGARQLTGVADGVVAAGSLHAVNGGQLHAASRSVADALGGGSFVNLDGSISGPSYSVGGTAYRTVGEAVSRLDSRFTEMQATVEDISTVVGGNELGLVK